MALLRNYIDQRTIISLAADGTASYAHGLPSAPDSVSFRIINQVTATAAEHTLRGVVNATNVTVYNNGAGASGDFEVTAIAFHSMIQ